MNLSFFHRIQKRLPSGIQVWVRHIQPKSYLIGLIGTLIIGSSYIIFFRNDTTTSVTQAIAAAEIRDITSSVKAVGKVTFASEQELRFNQRGTVTKVNYQEGDVVKKGDIIAELDKSTILADIRQAELSIAASNLQLQQMKNTSEKTLFDAENDLRTSQEKLPSDIATAERTVTEKTAALEQAKTDLEKQKISEFQSLGLTAQSTLTASEKLLDSYFAILTLDQSTRPPTTNTSYDYTFEINHLLYNDLTLKNTVQTDFFAAIKQAGHMREVYGSSLPSLQDGTTILKALTDAETLAKNIHALGEHTYALLQGATTDTTNFTVSELQSYRSTVNTNRATSASLVDSVGTARSNLASATGVSGIPSATLQQKEDAVKTAENALKLAKTNLQLLQAQTPGNIESKQKAYDNAAISTQTDVLLKQNDIAQKATSLQKTRQTLKEYELTAPFDGIITQLDYKIGDNLQDTGDTKSAMLQNPEFIVVTIPLDQVDVVRIKENMSATIVFDAVPDQPFEGVVDGIDSSPVEQSGVVSYNVEIKLPTPKDLTILSGMTATVTINTSGKLGVLTVPNLALSRSGNRTTVQLANGTTAIVEVGATDGRYTEILSGLQEGQQVVSLNVTATNAGNNTNSTQQLMRLSGAGGGGNFRPQR